MQNDNNIGNTVVQAPFWELPPKKPYFREAIGDSFDPYHRLCAAVALQAVCDLAYPTGTLDPDHTESAKRFISSNLDLFRTLGIPEKKALALASVGGPND